MILHVLDQSFNLIGVVDDYTSCIWRPAYYEVGDFELYIKASSEAVALLQPNYYLVRDTDISVENGVISYEKVMVIKGISLTTSAEDGDYLTYTGRELKYLLHSRIVWQQTNLTGTAEAGIRRLVTENAISPTNSKRVIPALTLGVSAGLTDVIEKQITGDYLDEAIAEICETYNYGWDVFIYNNQLVFIVYQGLDRSYGQTERPYVVFSDSFDNIISSEYQLQTEEYANCTLIGGEGEGTARKYTTVGADYTGLNRYELFTDAKDISSNEGEISAADYLKLLQERGREKLSELAITEGFSGEVITEGTFTYGRDFFIGDKVTVINKYGMSKNVMVLSAIESVDETGVKLIPQFNI